MLGMAHGMALIFRALAAYACTCVTAGGHWQRIPAPANIRNPACDRCGGVAACFLHLHGPTSWGMRGASMPAVYSSPSAPGLVMATGNVAAAGQGLDDNDGCVHWAWLMG